MSLGYLVPTGGGKPLALSKQRLYLGKRDRKSRSKVELPTDGYMCELLYINNCWQVRALGDTLLWVNGRPAQVRQLENGDEVSFGSGTYRIDYGPNQGPRQAASMLAARHATSQAPPEQMDAGPRKIPGLGILIPAAGGAPFTLRTPRLTVGRSRSCDLRINVSTVSSIHAGLEYAQGFWRAVDLNSSNGLRVNRVRHTGCWLSSGDTVTFGTVSYRIEYEHDGSPPREEDPTAFEMSLVDRLGWSAADVARVAQDADSD